MLKYSKTNISQRWLCGNYGTHEYHRINGPAIKWKYGADEWFISGQHHRLNGPADECVSDYRYWLLNNNLHCIEGPAAECVPDTKEWWINGVEYTKEDYARILKIKNAKV